MSTLSQFFPTAGETNTSGFRLFTTTGSYTLPAGVCYVAYSVIGGGAGRIGWCQSGAGTWYSGGAGGGFSYTDAALTCAATFTVCATIASPTCSTLFSCGNNTCLCGFSTGVICATGGKVCATSVTSPVGGLCCTVGCGVGGSINTCGGHGGDANSQCGCGGGGGAGGIFGNGGDGGHGQSSCCGWGQHGGGGGYGSGGGGGGAEAAQNFDMPARGGQGGAKLGGNGTNAGGYSFSGGIGGECRLSPSSGFIPSYTDDGKFSQIKTFLAASGGGGYGGLFCTCAVNQKINGPSGGAAGGGGGACAPGGFGAGSGGGACSSISSGIGGGAGSGGCGGGGFAAIEWWIA